MIHNEEYPLSRSILKTLIYFDLFRYPLTAEEVHAFFPEADVSINTIQISLSQMVGSGKIYQLGRFYSVQNSPELERRRTDGNLLAIQYMKKAHRQAKVISRFPYVEGVMVSGSLSKGHADPTSDIDFFIVTKPGRLWIARTLLVMYKRIWLLNSHKYFCVNYFVDSEHLDINEQNIYTAIELATLIPLYGHRCYLALIEKNDWIRTYCPNFVPHESSSETIISYSFSPGRMPTIFIFMRRLPIRARAIFSTVAEGALGT